MPGPGSSFPRTAQATGPGSEYSRVPRTHGAETQGAVATEHGLVAGNGSGNACRDLSAGASVLLRAPLWL